MSDDRGQMTAVRMDNGQQTTDNETTDHGLPRETDIGLPVFIDS
jgi:hypothetical protein